jgi:hypothetical protein
MKNLIGRLVRIEERLSDLEPLRQRLIAARERINTRLAAIEPTRDRLVRRRAQLRGLIALEAVVGRDGEPKLGAELDTERRILEEAKQSRRRRGHGKGVSRPHGRLLR